jgi:hypothetical protein
VDLHTHSDADRYANLYADEHAHQYVHGDACADHPLADAHGHKDAHPNFDVYPDPDVYANSAQLLPGPDL